MSFKQQFVINKKDHKTKNSDSTKGNKGKHSHAYYAFLESHYNKL